MIDAAGGLWAVFLRFVVFTATVGALGAWVFGRFVAARLAGDVGTRHRGALGDYSVRVALWCLAALCAASIWRHPVQGILAAVAAAALLFAPRTRAWPVLAEAAVAALAVVPAFLGHAAAAESWAVASVVVDIAHVASAGGWVGALSLLTVAVLRERKSVDAPGLAAALVIAFHPVAMIAAGTVFVTGIATAWLRMGVPEGIASSTYSGLFVAKLLLVGVTAAFGAGHSKFATKRVQSLPLPSVSRTLLAECALAVVVLGVTAVLAGTNAIG